MTTTALSVLAQQGVGRIIGLVIAIIVLVIVAGVVLMLIRRRIMGDLDGAGGESIGLSEIREMYERGELSDQEYGALRRAAIGAFGFSAPASAPEERELRAPPGVDLSGEPLPGFPSEPETDGDDDAEDENGPSGGPG